jgi:hypothetical protein
MPLCHCVIASQRVGVAFGKFPTGRGKDFNSHCPIDMALCLIGTGQQARKAWNVWRVTGRLFARGDRAIVG